MCLRLCWGVWGHSLHTRRECGIAPDRGCYGSQISSRKGREIGGNFGQKRHGCKHARGKCHSTLVGVFKCRAFGDGNDRVDSQDWRYRFGALRFFGWIVFFRSQNRFGYRWINEYVDFSLLTTIRSRKKMKSKKNSHFFFRQILFWSKSLPPPILSLWVGQIKKSSFPIRLLFCQRGNKKNNLSLKHQFDCQIVWVLYSKKSSSKSSSNYITLTWIPDLCTWFH